MAAHAPVVILGMPLLVYEIVSECNLCDMQAVALALTVDRRRRRARGGMGPLLPPRDKD